MYNYLKLETTSKLYFNYHSFLLILFLKILTKIIQTLIFGNIYISFATVLMSLYTFYIFEITPNPDFLLFVFFATLTSYSFHWFLTPDVHSHSERYIWVNDHKKLLIGLFVIGSAGSVIFLYELRTHFWLLTSLALFTFLYSASKIPVKPFEYLKRIVIPKTLHLATAWTIVTVILPIIITEKSWETQNTIFTLNRFFLIYPICALFDYRDMEEDKIQGISNLVGLLSLNQIKLLYYVCLTLFFITGGILPLYGFHLLELSILLHPGIFLLFSFNSSIGSVSDYWYYFYLDGLMMLSAVMTILVKIL